MWFTANIGVHHIHHLCSRIPFYRLPLALRQHADLADVGRLTLGQSLACVRLVLWDEAARRLISFRELRMRVGDGAVEHANAAAALLIHNNASGLGSGAGWHRNSRRAARAKTSRVILQ